MADASQPERTSASEPASAPADMVEPPGESESTTDTSPRTRRADPLLLEASWEVCNQVGGIYTVLRSKIPSIMSRWGNRYCLVGPYNQGTAHVEFEAAPLVGSVGQVVKQMRDEGYDAHYGRWLVTGRPHVVLLNPQDAMPRLHEVKYRLWADHEISTPANDETINNAVAFGELLRQFMTLLAQREAPRRKLLLHLHEWQAGVAVPMLRRQQWPGGLVFTTHATLLGRYLAMHDPSFYEHLPRYNADTEARHFNVEAQHRIEAAAAHGSHVFTTVSDVTAEECRHLLGRRPDVLLPNGLNIQRFAALHEFQNLHAYYKAQLHEFTIGHFFPSYSFDLDTTLYFFTSGRYEYRNKGMDLTIEALARLNHRLRQAGSPVTVVFFIVTRAPVRSINVTALQSRAMLREFRTAADGIKEQVGERLFHAVTAGHVPDLNTLMDEYWRLRMRRAMHAWKRDLPPPIITHDLADDSRDDVLNHLRRCRLFNHEHDPVKIIYHPEFINATNPLFGIDYDQFVRGCHLGVFPSYYEPWGYTPLESIALGVPAITSNLSGFGSYLQQLITAEREAERRRASDDPTGGGVYILDRRHQGFEEAASDLADHMFQYCQFSRRERINLRNHVESFSEHFDWHNLGKRYHEAHDMALGSLPDPAAT